MRDMTTGIRSSALALLFAGLAWAASTTDGLRLVPNESRMELTVEKTGLLSGKKHLFTFRDFEGRFDSDQSQPEHSTIALSIATTSIQCEDKWLSAADLNKVQQYALKDMLAVARFPRILFQSGAIRKTAAGYEVRGTLTIREKAKPVTLNVSVRTGSNGSTVLEGTSRFRLTDFGLKPPSAALGTIGTKDEILFHFVLATVEQANR